MIAASRRSLELLRSRSWLLFVTASLAVAIPIFVLGDVSDEAARDRLRASHRDSTAYTADVVAHAYRERVGLIRTTIASLVLTPHPGTSPLAVALERGDTGSLQSLADLVRYQYPRYVVRAYIALRGDAEIINDGTIAAVSPADPALLGRRLSDLPEPARQTFALMRRTGTLNVGGPEIVVLGVVAGPYAAEAEPHSRLMAAAGLPERRLRGTCVGAGCAASLSSAVLIAELDNSRIFVDAAEPALDPADDAYLVSADRRLIARVRAPAGHPLRDLRGDPFVDLLTPATPTIARVGAQDPLGGGPRVIAAVPSSVNPVVPASSVVILRDTSLIDRQAEDTLTQLATFRAVIVVMLLVLAVLGTLALRHVTLGAVYEERLRVARDVHDLLGHGLSLITLKAQLARRLLESGAEADAVREISETEEVARASLHDVRQAIDGYRQPTLGSALVGARAALQAAGIESRLESDSGGPLPSAVDAAFAWALREAVTNVIRHSGAATCSIRIRRRTHEAMLEILDDGRRGSSVGPGNGLRGLSERVAARGGRSEVGPHPEGGYRVLVTIPL